MYCVNESKKKEKEYPKKQVLKSEVLLLKTNVLIFASKWTIINLLYYIKYK